MMARRLVTACDRVLTKTANDRGFEEGKAWEHLVRVMTAILERRDLPTGATQSRDKSIRDRPSAFVALFSEIQKNLPPNIRRHDRAGHLSLAKKINEARRGSRSTFANADVLPFSQWQSDSSDTKTDPALEHEIADVWGPGGGEKA